MSAFVVSHDHIDALVEYAVTHRLRYFVDGLPIYITTDNATEVGAILLQENVRSVLSRYPDCTEETAPGRDGEMVAYYDFEPFLDLHKLPKHKLVAVILTACDCFDYQACETDNYEASVACKIIEAIRTEAIRAVPKYDAPWEITRDQVKTFAHAR